MSAIAQFTHRLLTGMARFRRLATSTTANISILAALSFMPLHHCCHRRDRPVQWHPHQEQPAGRRRRRRLAAATALASGYGDTDKKKIAEDTFFANLSPQPDGGVSGHPGGHDRLCQSVGPHDVQVNTDQLLTNSHHRLHHHRGRGDSGGRPGHAGVPDDAQPDRLEVAQYPGHRRRQRHRLRDPGEFQPRGGHAPDRQLQGRCGKLLRPWQLQRHQLHPMPRRHCMRQQDPLAAKFAEIWLPPISRRWPCKGDINKIKNDRNSHGTSILGSIAKDSRSRGK
jgi:hypothetical protein